MSEHFLGLVFFGIGVLTLISVLFIAYDGPVRKNHENIQVNLWDIGLIILIFLSITVLDSITGVHFITKPNTDLTSFFPSIGILISALLASISMHRASINAKKLDELKAEREIALEEKKSKRDLYENRMKIFQYTSAFLVKIIHETNFHFNDSIDFYRKTASARFLYGEDINELLKQYYEKSVDFDSLLKSINTSRSVDRLSQAAEQELRQKEEQKHALSVWFLNENKTLENKFDDYLREC